MVECDVSINCIGIVQQKSQLKSVFDLKGMLINVKMEEDDFNIRPGTLFRWMWVCLHITAEREEGS